MVNFGSIGQQPYINQQWPSISKGQKTGGVEQVPFGILPPINREITQGEINTGNNLNVKENPYIVEQVPFGILPPMNFKPTNNLGADNNPFVAGNVNRPNLDTHFGQPPTQMGFGGPITVNDGLMKSYLA